MIKTRSLAVIPARGGSKSIPRKNIVPVGGRPLIAYTIEAALESGSFDRTVVSTDDDEIARISKSLGAEVFLRPEALARDETPSEPVISHALKEADPTSQGLFGIAMLLQPTSPLRSVEDIRMAVELIRSGRAKSVISVTSVGCLPYKSFFIDKNGELNGLMDNLSPFKRRQDLPESFKSNGAIYAVSVTDFMVNPRFFISPCLPLVMPAERSVDLDEPEDLLKIEALIKRSMDEAL